MLRLVDDNTEPVDERQAIRDAYEAVRAIERSPLLSRAEQRAIQALADLLERHTEGS